jgi:hypothetical protein
MHLDRYQGMIQSKCGLDVAYMRLRLHKKGIYG